MEKLIKKNGLLAPESFHALSIEKVRELTNGCGPSGWGWLVPDKFRLMGIDFTQACCVHDFSYTIGMPKDKADKIFLENLSYCATKARPGFRNIAQWMAFQYYLAVKNGGSGAYHRARKKWST